MSRVHLQQSCTLSLLAGVWRADTCAGAQASPRPSEVVARPTGLPLPPQVPVLSALPVPALTGVSVSCSAANCPGGCSNNRPSDGAPLAGSAQHTTAMSPWWSGYCVCVTLQALKLQPWRGWVIRGALAVCRNRGLGGSLSFI